MVPAPNKIYENNKPVKIEENYKSGEKTYIHVYLYN